MRFQIFVYAKTKISNCEADQHLYFQYSDSTITSLHKSEISSFERSSVAVQPSLCRTWSKPHCWFSYGVAYIMRLILY